MKTYLGKALNFFTTLFLVTLVTFLTFQVLPGDPATAILGAEAEEAQIIQKRAELGLDQSLYIRYFKWIGGALHGDLGNSYRYDQKVFDLIKGSLKTTAALAFLSLLITVVLGLFFGILFAATRKNKFFIALSTISQIWVSIPSFCTGILLILVFTVTFNLLPSVDYNGPSSLILPSFAIALGSSSILCRYIKTSIENELKQDYVRTARSKGLNETQVIFRHVLRNALLPSITTLGLITADIFGGSLIVEKVFSLPGIGSLIIKSISDRDFPLIQGLTLYLAFLTLFCNFAVDMLYSIIDPRTKSSRNKEAAK